MRTVEVKCLDWAFEVEVGENLGHPRWFDRAIKADGGILASRTIEVDCGCASWTVKDE